MTPRFLLVLLPSLVLACSGDDGDDKSDDDHGADAYADAGDADTDADTDADSDADTDADSDADSDTSQPEPDCADAGVPLDPTSFADTFEDKYCWVVEHTCGAGPCDRPDYEPPPGCVFDPVAACACLDTSWPCVGGVPANGPCEAAWRCEGTETDTAWWVDTSSGSGGGTVGGGSGTIGGSGTTGGGSGTVVGGSGTVVGGSGGVVGTTGDTGP